MLNFSVNQIANEFYKKGDRLSALFHAVGMVINMMFSDGIGSRHSLAGRNLEAELYPYGLIDGDVMHYYDVAPDFYIMGPNLHTAICKNFRRILDYCRIPYPTHPQRYLIYYNCTKLEGMVEVSITPCNNIHHDPSQEIFLRIPTNKSDCPDGCFGLI